SIQQTLTTKGWQKGDPFCCLPIVSYAFTSFSPALAELLVESGIELTGKNDLSFTESVYKVLRDLFSYKPLLSKQQFLQFGFAERKISLLCDIIGLVVTKHNQLTRGAKPVRHPKKRLQSRSDSKILESPTSPDTHGVPAQRLQSRSVSLTSESPTTPDTHRIPAQRLQSRSVSITSESPTTPNTHRIPAQRLQSRSVSIISESPTSPDTHRIPVLLSRPLVERHLGNNSSARACFSSDTSPQEKRDEAEEEGGGPSAGDGPRPAAHTGFVSECMLKAVEAGLRECVSRMAQLDARLQAVEQSAAGKLVIERSQWENLESRVLLLETSLALISVQGPVKAGGVASLSGFGEKSHLTEETVVLTSAEGPGNSAALGQSASEAGSATHPSTGLPSASPEETIKERLERIANMMKDTSSLLKTTF
uniref:Centrosomal protein of 44 kDa n=1 Tax=Electrophorus electricus TaxID=8005 RepID=A0A4W4GJR4_ELEEL